MTEALFLGNLAVRVGQRIEWDGPNLHITNNEAANQFVNKKYRDGWLHDLTRPPFRGAYL